MANLSILVPEATTNYIKNPAIRIDTTGWNAYNSATISRSTTYSQAGVSSLKVVTPGTLTSEGVYYRVNELATKSDQVSASVYVRGEGKVILRLQDEGASDPATPTDKKWDTDVVILSEDRWQRVSVPGYCAKSDNMSLYVITYGDIPQAVTFYVDAAQMELHEYATTYCDGFQPGCFWNGLYDSSTSSRSAYTREGGKWVLVSGAYREREDVYMTVVTGLGVAPISNNRQSYSMSPGGYLDNVKIQERQISLLFHTKYEHLPRTCKDALSLNKLHELRQMLIDIIKPDLTSNNQPFWIEYKDGDIPLYMKVHYDGGLEGDWDIRNQWMMSFPLRLLALSPMFYEDNQQNYELNFVDTATINYIAGRIDGEWDTMNGGMNGKVGEIAIGKNGEIYAGGKFTKVNNTSTTSVFAYYNGSEWISLASTLTGTEINDIAVAPNGNVYVGGTFSNIGGTAAANIAMWNGTAWSALGTGVNSTVRGIGVAPNGDVYVGGDFTTAGGITNRYIAKWDGSSWQRVGAKSGMNNPVYTLVVSNDGNYVYVGGDFTDQYTLSANTLIRVAKLTVSTNTFSALGYGFNDIVYTLALTESNILYAGGIFTTSPTTPTAIPILRVGKWSGSLWEQVGDGVDGPVYCMKIDNNDNVVIGGNFSNSGDVSLRKFALWNGSIWSSLDLHLNPGTVTVNPNAVAFRGKDIFVGGEYFNNNASKLSGITYVTNYGSAEVRPIFYFKGYGKLVYIENESTGARMWFNLTILTDEEVYLDLGNGRFYSNVRGNLFYTLLPGSDFHKFVLRPGVNKIAVLKRNDVSAQVRVMYTPVHWSADATKIVEAF